jgi:uroporphyrinogen-III synthase
VARDLVPLELSKRGARVDVVEAYRTAAPAGLAAQAKSVLARKPHWITFTSSSTVKNLVAAVGAPALAGIRIASIGPVTSATARELGLRVDVEANPHTMAGLVAGLVAAIV